MKKKRQPDELGDLFRWQAERYFIAGPCRSVPAMPLSTYTAKRDIGGAEF